MAECVKCTRGLGTHWSHCRWGGTERPNPTYTTAIHTHWVEGVCWHAFLPQEETFQCQPNPKKMASSPENKQKLNKMENGGSSLAPFFPPFNVV